MKTVTVVYEIEDQWDMPTFGKLLSTVPIPGLKAVSVGLGDAIEARQALRDLWPVLIDYPSLLVNHLDLLNRAEKALKVSK